VRSKKPRRTDRAFFTSQPRLPHSKWLDAPSDASIILLTRIGGCRDSGGGIQEQRPQMKVLSGPEIRKPVQTLAMQGESRP
jgi:hypothetical protein